MKYITIIVILICSFIRASVVDLTLYLPNNYVANGSVDYTSYLQKGIDDNKQVIMPNFPILINYKGLNINSNQIITFSSKSKLIMKPNDKTNYAILNIENVRNVIIKNAVLEGDLKKHLYNKGEWGMGISILNSDNVKIYNSNIKETWGDGIYLGESKKKKQFQNTNTNIEIIGGNISNCNRNGISIITGKNITIKDIYIADMQSKLPKTGIDIEPNSKTNVVQNITLKNITLNNNLNGISVLLANLLNEDIKVSIGNILIDSLKDEYSRYYGVLISNEKPNMNLLKEFQGYIKIINPTFYKINSKSIFIKNNAYNPKILIKGIKTLNQSKTDILLKLQSLLKENKKNRS